MINSYFKLIIIVGLVIIFAFGSEIWLKLGSSSKLNNLTSPTISSSPVPEYPEATSYKVPILMYHYIRSAEGESELGQNLSVSPQNFNLQMKLLKENDYQTIYMSDLSDPKKEMLSKILFEKKKPIIVTFDDGYEDAYTRAYPILKKYDFTGTFYIIRNFLGKPEYLNQNQIDEMKQNRMEIASHTLSHPDLSKISISDARMQIVNSKEDSTSFCYPAGRFNEEVISEVKSAGYLTAVTTKNGIATESSSLLELPRVRIENISAQALLNKLP